jgi:hypothetical protein
VVFISVAISIPLNTISGVTHYQQAIAQSIAAKTTIISNFLIYQNPTYGISMQYPSDWTVNKTNNPSDISSPISNFVWFYPPHDDDSVSISIAFPDPRVTNDLTTYPNFAASSLSQRSLDERFNVIKSNTTSKLAGLLAYSLEYSSINAEDNTTYVTLELGTIISGKC